MFSRGVVSLRAVVSERYWPSRPEKSPGTKVDGPTSVSISTGGLALGSGLRLWSSGNPVCLIDRLALTSALLVLGWS